MKDWNLISEELLSAYLDGETTAEETTEVERWLADSELAQQTLAEFRQIGSLVHQQASADESITPEFTTSVMRAIELKAGSLAESTLVSADDATKRFRNYRREWFASLAAVSVSALAVLITVKNGVHPSSHETPIAPRFGIKESITLTSEATPATAGSSQSDFDSTRHDSLVALRPGVEVSDGVTLPRELMLRRIAPETKEISEKTRHTNGTWQDGTMDSSKSGGNRLVASADPKPAGSPEMPAPAAPATAAFAASTRDRKNAAPAHSSPQTLEAESPAAKNQPGRGTSLTAATGSKDASAKRPDVTKMKADSLAENSGTASLPLRIGDVIPYMPTGESAAVGLMELTVVDIDRTLGEICVVLRRKSVSELNLENKDLADNQTSVRHELAKNPAMENRQKIHPSLYALYLEANPQQLTDAFHEMENQGLLANARLQPPLQPEELLIANPSNNSAPISIDAVAVTNALEMRLKGLQKMSNEEYNGQVRQQSVRVANRGIQRTYAPAYSGFANDEFATNRGNTLLTGTESPSDGVVSFKNHPIDPETTLTNTAPLAEIASRRLLETGLNPPPALQSNALGNNRASMNQGNYYQRLELSQNADADRLAMDGTNSKVRDAQLLKKGPANNEFQRPGQTSFQAPLMANSTSSNNFTFNNALGLNPTNNWAIGRQPELVRMILVVQKKPN